MLRNDAVVMLFHVSLLCPGDCFQGGEFCPHNAAGIHLLFIVCVRIRQNIVLVIYLIKGIDYLNPSIEYPGSMNDVV